MFVCRLWCPGGVGAAVGGAVVCDGCGVGDALCTGGDGGFPVLPPLTGEGCSVGVGTGVGDDV